MPLTKFNNEMHSADNWVLILSFYIIDKFAYFDIVQVLCYNLYC